ncbi:MAG TPA: glycosyltransferase family 39 protein [Chthoniobacterales bacterium]
MLESRVTLCFVAALVAVLFSLTNWPWTLDEYEQAKQAYTSFEMVNEGHWFYQHTPNEKSATKPPLVGWISAATYEVTRSWELAWRLPSVGAAVVIGVVLLRVASEAYGASAGLLALSAFGLNLLSPRIATLVRTDMPLALVIFLLGLQIWRKLRANAPWNTHDRVIAFALLTAAMMIKGPIVFAFLLPGVVTFEFVRRRNGWPKSAWCGWRAWLASLAVFLLWVELGIAFVPGFYEEAVLKEFLGRFSETVHRPQPFYFYLLHLLHRFAPWSLLLIGLAIAQRKQRLSAESVWLICWSLGALVLMSFIPSKRVDRIFPVVPPLCLLLAAFFKARPARVWAIAALISAVLIATGNSAWRIHSAYRSDDAALARFGAAVREQTANNHWRYDVVGGREEALLLYLRRMHFTLPEVALERWKRGETDAVVLSLGKLSLVRPANFAGAVPTGIEATIIVNGEPRPYALLKRAP